MNIKYTEGKMVVTFTKRELRTIEDAADLLAGLEQVDPAAKATRNGLVALRMATKASGSYVVVPKEADDA